MNVIRNSEYSMEDWEEFIAAKRISGNSLVSNRYSIENVSELISLIWCANFKDKPVLTQQIYK